MEQLSESLESNEIVARIDQTLFRDSDCDSKDVDTAIKYRMTTKDVNVYYSEVHAIKNVNLSIRENEVLSIIGASGCGKSTFLRCLNRINDIVEDCRITGEIKLDGKDIYHSDLDVVELRARVGMVFQKPNPFPKSIYDNVAYGPRLHSMVNSRSETDDVVYSCLRQVGLLSEVEDRIHKSGTELSWWATAAVMHRPRPGG